jgi:hypothetical protein
MVMDKSKVLEMIRSGTTDVVFTKKDGTARAMKCTLNEEYLPTPIESGPGEDDKPKKTVNPDVLAVYDVEVAGWRSFRWDALQSVSGERFSLGKE